MINDSTALAEELHNKLQNVICFCEVCQPPFQLLETDRNQFSDLVISGQVPDAVENLEAVLNLGSQSAFRAHELDFSSIEKLAEDLSRLPINENCRKIEKLAEVVRDAGALTGFYGPIATDRILQRDKPRKPRWTR